MHVPLQLQQHALNYRCFEQIPYNKTAELFFLGNEAKSTEIDSSILQAARNSDKINDQKHFWGCCWKHIKYITKIIIYWDRLISA